MLGYRIKQTAFMIAGFVGFFFSWEWFVHETHGRYPTDLIHNMRAGHVVSAAFWLFLCLAAGH